MAFFLGLLTFTGAHGVVTAVDDRDVKVTLPAAAQRIVALSPHLVENLYAIGAGNRIVAVPEHSDFPPQAAGIEVIGSYDRFDIERILQLAPDLVVGWLSGNPSADLERIEALGVPVFLSEPRAPEGVAQELRSLGSLTGLDARAEEAAREYLVAIGALRSAYADRETVRVFYQVWNDPVITLNGDHLVSRIIEYCGGRNVFAEVSGLAPVIDGEAVIERDPDVIIASGVDARPPPWLDHWLRFPFLRAVRNNALYHLDPDLVQRHTTRLVEGMKRLCALIDAGRSAPAPR